MTIDPETAATATARRNLAQRIGRLLAKIEQEGRAPTAWEAHYTSIALEKFEHNYLGDGEWTMLHAERQDTFDTLISPKPLPADAKKATAAELRARLTELHGDG